MKYLLLATVAGLLTLTLQEAPQGASKSPVVGQPAPALRLNDHTGKIVTLGGKTKNWSVLAFYPKAMTPGCTSEVCSMRDSFETLSTVGADIYGISLDSVQDQAQFVQKHELNFPLLSDPDGSVATKYGVLDPTAQYTKRVTFVIDEKGVLRKVLDQVDVNTHGEDLAALIDELRK